MAYVLVKEYHDWADEFSTYGFAIYEKEKFYEDLKFLEENWREDTELYFGTNEAMEWESFEDLKRGLEVLEITEEEAEVFKKFGMKFYGQTFFDRALEQIDYDE